jgi:hypothetical protein
VILTSKIPYDLLYRQFDWNREPFGRPLKHWLWYKSLFCKHILCLKPKKCEGWILDVGGGTGPLFDIFSREEKEKYINLDLSLYLLRKSKGEHVRGMAEYFPSEVRHFAL